MREIMTGVRVTLVLWLLTAIIYPLFMVFIGQAIFPFQANGSLLKNAQGQIIGSALIGQNFASPQYFWSRPSTTNYSSFTASEFNPQNPENRSPKTGTSGASNFAPSNPDLLKRINQEITRLKQAGINPTADLIYTSGSSLDPHISVESALAQIDRIAKTRAISSNQLEILVSRYTDNRFLGIFGEPGVNVLQLNLALEVMGNGK